MILPGFGTTGRKRTDASGWRGPEVATLPDWNSGVARKSLRAGSGRPGRAEVDHLRALDQAVGRGAAGHLEADEFHGEGLRRVGLIAGRCQSQTKRLRA